MTGRTCVLNTSSIKPYTGRLPLFHSMFFNVCQRVQVNAVFMIDRSLLWLLKNDHCSTKWFAHAVRIKVHRVLSPHRGSSYFKSMLQLTTIEEIIEEIKNYADTLDVPWACLMASFKITALVAVEGCQKCWEFSKQDFCQVYNSGSSTSPSNFVCQAWLTGRIYDGDDGVSTQEDTWVVLKVVTNRLLTKNICFFDGQSWDIPIKVDEKPSGVPHLHPSRSWRSFPTAGLGILKIQVHELVSTFRSMYDAIQCNEMYLLCMFQW